MQNSLDVLVESLDMKINVLRDIESYNKLQQETFEKEEVDMDSFDDAIEKKEELIQRLEKLDDGFEILYAKLAEQIKANRDKYASQIKDIQGKISVITELSISIQASEARNKKLIEQYFAKERNTVKNGRVGSRAAYDYYKNMSGMNVAGPQFMDSKN